MLFPRNPFNKDLFVEYREYISIFDLKKAKLIERYRFPQQFGIRGIRFKLVQDPIERDWYIELVNYGPRCRTSAINMTQTPCNYGGTREWFLCPKCERRVGILYKDGDNFECRKCLGLLHYTSILNYRTVAPVLYKQRKLEKINFFKIRQGYNGKITKRYEQYEKLRAQTMFGMNMWAGIYKKRK